MTQRTQSDFACVTTIVMTFLLPAGAASAGSSGDSACSSSGHHCLTVGPPGCDDGKCCAAICAQDPWCCTNSWDELCVLQAMDVCTDLLPPETSVNPCTFAIPDVSGSYGWFWCIPTPPAVLGDCTLVLTVPETGLGLYLCDFTLPSTPELPEPTPPSISDPPSPIVAHDWCEYAIPLDLGETAFKTVGADVDGPEFGFTCPVVTQIPPLPFGPDLWYLYTATGRGLLTVSTCGGTDFATRLEAYLGATCLGPLVGCNEQGADCAWGASEMTFPVTAGTVYTIRVGGVGAVEGSGTLTLSFSPSPHHGPPSVAAP
ncbi:MAG TPA: hypothetical protein PKC43_10260 [Phycisphaerales bacterium]|nr:hypothetical protein [Phycisphaerales bacterium]HMP37819.1 hypothetical protein [Phycisphaerales bacterium]